MKLSESSNTIDNIVIKEHRLDDLKDACPEWDALTKSQKLEVSRTVEPVGTSSTHNVTTLEYHEYLVDLGDYGTASSIENMEFLALGSDDTPPDENNTALNVEEFRTGVTDFVNNGAEALMSTFMDSTEGNGITYVEGGIFSYDTGGTGIMFNHGILDQSRSKTSDNTITVDVTITHRNPV